MLTAKNLGFRVGSRWLVKDVDLNILSGEFAVIVGANGAGKTSLLRLLAGEWMPAEGDVYLQDKPIRSYSLKELALQRSVMRQQVELNFDFTVEEVVMMGRFPHNRGIVRNVDDKIVAAVMTRTETDHMRRRLYNTLSAGEKARVTLGRVLAQQTTIILMDEPTATMDLRHQQLTMDIARGLVDDGHSVVAVLHDLNLASLYADRVGMMRNGHLYAIGTPPEVFTPENIAAVFNIDVHILSHPDSNTPLIVPLHRQNAGKLE